VVTSAAVGGGAPSPPKPSRGGNREGAPSPTRSCARSDQAGASELKKKPLQQLGLEKQKSSFRSFRLQWLIYSSYSRLVQSVLGELLDSKVPLENFRDTC
jgi:hypothetical protein